MLDLIADVEKGFRQLESGCQIAGCDCASCDYNPESDLF